MSTVHQPDTSADDLTELDLTCPSCSADLILDESFLTARVCGTCHRHFSIGSRERLALLVDPGTFEEFRTPDPVGLEDASPATLPSAERIAEQRDRQVVADAVVTGTASIGGNTVMLVVLDDHLVGEVLGATLVEKIVDALGQAIGRKLPVVLEMAGGAPSPSPGPLAVVQPGRLASVFAQVHLADLPVIGVLAHPVSSANNAALASHCDILLAEPGAQIGSAISTSDSDEVATRRTSEELVAEGWIDAITDRLHTRSQLIQILDLVLQPGSIRSVVRPPSVAPSVPVSLETPGVLDHPNRPTGAEIQASLLADVVELRGDRVSGDCPAVTTGLARFESLSVAFVLLRDVDGADLGLAARKIARLARLASRLERPIVVLVDESAASASVDVSIPNGQAIAALAGLLAVLPVPIVAVGLRKVASPLGFALMAGDRQFLLSNARFVVNAGAETGLLRQPGRPLAGGTRLTARDCERLGLIDAIIEEPLPGAHVDPAGTVGAVRAALAGALAELVGTGSRRLLDTRYRRQRELGLSTPEGLAAVRSELWEIQEWQRSVGRSLDDWRERWDQFRAGTGRDQGRRIELPDLMARLRTRRDEVLARTGRTGTTNVHRDDAERD